MVGRAMLAMALSRLIRETPHTTASITQVRRGCGSPSLSLPRSFSLTTAVLITPYSREQNDRPRRAGRLIWELPDEYEGRARNRAGDRLCSQRSPRAPAGGEGA